MQDPLIAHPRTDPHHLLNRSQGGRSRLSRAASAPSVAWHSSRQTRVRRKDHSLMPTSLGGASAKQPCMDNEAHRCGVSRGSVSAPERSPRKHLTHDYLYVRVFCVIFNLRRGSTAKVATDVEHTKRFVAHEM